MTDRRLRANALLLLCAAIWGFAFVAQAAGAHVGAFTFISTRFVLGAVSLLPVVAWRDRRAGVHGAAALERWRETIVPGLVVAVFLLGGAVLQQLGIERTTAGNAAFVTGLYVVLVPLVGVVVGQRSSLTIWLGALIALVGLYLLTMTDGPTGMNAGDLLCLVGTLFWTGHILSVGVFAGRADPVRLAAMQFFVVGVVTGIVALVVEPHAFLGLDTAVLPILYAGIMSSGVAFTLQVLGQRDALASHAAIIMSLETLFGALGGALLLGEVMSGAGYLGAALMLAGIVCSQLPGRGVGTVPLVPVPEPPSTALETAALADRPRASTAGGRGVTSEQGESSPHDPVGTSTSASGRPAEAIPCPPPALDQHPEEPRLHPDRLAEASVRPPQRGDTA